MDLDVFKKANVAFAFLETESVWGLQERLSEIVKPRYFAEDTESRTVPWSIYLVWMEHLALVIFVAFGGVQIYVPSFFPYFCLMEVILHCNRFTF